MGGHPGADVHERGLKGPFEAQGWHYRRSLASRVALLTTIVVGLSVAVAAAAAFVTVRMAMQSALDESMLNRATKAAEGGALAEIQLQLPPWMYGAADVRIAVITANREIRSLDRGPDILELGEPELAVARGTADQSVRTIRTDAGARYRVVTVPAGTDQALILAQSLAAQELVLRKLGLAMLIAGALGVLAAALAGWGVARNGLRPVRRLTSAVEHIARTEDLRPLQVEGDDEVARLATAFNSMLVSLAASRDRQRRLVADAGHELRTPLTSLRTNLDLLAQVDAPGASHGRLPPEARAELIDDVRAQIEEMTNLVGDLVELARDEPITHVVEAVDLGDVLDRALTKVRRRAPLVDFQVHAEPWWVVGESASLERAVTNLLDNAAKWSPADPPGGVVRVTLVDGTLTVDDNGPGIAPADLPHVFDRFYRSEESRAMPGSGLGLSIVRQVVERHSGSVTAGAAPTGGARLTLTLPGAPEPVSRAQPWPDEVRRG
ncbi:HAMP domain-containing sensor histidine kinase [Nocardioides bigeumensis]|uniref:histidine kinase n=1 Tax=Nocardioides bigeumensis TaxID=433657 RepID=A0ABN2YXU1_9ACTN